MKDIFGAILAVLLLLMQFGLPLFMIYLMITQPSIILVIIGISLVFGLIIKLFSKSN